MGLRSGSSEYIFDDIYWYFVKQHQYFLFGGPPCFNWVADIGCCQSGPDLKTWINFPCMQGAISCGTDLSASFKIIEVSGPYDSHAMCIAGNPRPEFEEHMFTKNLSFVISETYNFMPTGDIKFEMEIPKLGNAWGFFCNASQENRIHISFDSNAIADVLYG